MSDSRGDRKRDGQADTSERDLAIGDASYRRYRDTF